MAKYGINSVRRAYRSWRGTWIQHWDSRWVRAFAWLDLMVLDFGFLRPFFNRTTRVSDGVFRSNQPSPRNIKKLQKQGFRTVLSLRKPESCGYHLLEKMACEEAGISLINFAQRSRRLPTLAEVQEIKTIFESAPKPMLIHCKSGADRAGLFSALYLLLIDSVPPEVALQQLSLKYLHIKQSKTGVFDYCLELYRAETLADKEPFLAWAARRYDPDLFKKEFVPKHWANILVDGVLRRE